MHIYIKCDIVDALKEKKIEKKVIKIYIFPSVHYEKQNTIREYLKQQEHEKLLEEKKVVKFLINFLT